MEWKEDLHISSVVNLSCQWCKKKRLKETNAQYTGFLSKNAGLRLTRYLVKMSRREKVSQAMPDCLSQAIFPEAMAPKKNVGFLQNFMDFSKDTNRYVLGPDRQTTEKLPLPAEAFRRARGEHEQGCGMQEQALPRLGAAGRRQRKAGSARNKRGSSQGKRGPARGTRGWVGGDESRSVLDNYSCISSSSSKMSWRVLEQREEPDTLRKRGSALSRISSGAGVRGWHRKPREAGNSRNPDFAP